MKVELARLVKIHGIFGIRARPAALDIIHAQVVQQFGNPNFVGDGKRDAFALCAIAERRIVDRDPLLHNRPP